MKKLTPWNIQDHLKTNEDRVNYLEAALEENDKEFAAIVLGEIAESLGLLAVVYDHPSKLYANGLRMSPPDLDMTEIQAIIEKHQKTKQN